MNRKINLSCGSLVPSIPLAEIVHPITGLLPLFRESFDRAALLPRGVNHRPAPMMRPRGAQEQGCTRVDSKPQEPLGPALTRTPPSARLPLPGCSPDPGPRPHPPGRSLQPLGPRAAPVPAAPSATSPLPRAAGQATTPRKRPHGKRAYSTQEARTLGSCSRHCWEPGSACRPPRRRTLSRRCCLQPCSPLSLPGEKRLIKASRGLLGLVVARSPGRRATGLHWHSFRHYVSRQAASWARPRAWHHEPPRAGLELIVL